MHTVLHWSTLGLVLLATLAVGICVHELLHLVPLHLADVGYTVTVLPTADAASSSATADAASSAGGRDAATPTAWTTLKHAFTGSFVRVEVTHLPPATPAWVVRAAALLPLALALPLLLVAAGVLPDPLAADNYVATVALVAWTGCGLPSPADWAVVWHGSPASRVAEAESDR